MDFLPQAWHLVFVIGLLLAGFTALDYLYRTRLANTRTLNGTEQPLTVMLICKNQERHLEFMVRRILAITSLAGPVYGRVLIVNASSEDGTGPIARRLAETSGAVFAIPASPYAGDWRERLASAYEASAGSVVVCCWPRDEEDWERLLSWLQRMSERREIAPGFGSDGKDSVDS